MQNKEVDADSSIQKEEVNYYSENRLCKGYIAFDVNKNENLPVVIIVHEWWGLNEYARSRARQIAALGYFAFAVDLFGDGKLAHTPEEARAMTLRYYLHPENTLKPIEDAISFVAGFPQADLSKIAAMGYCFGGYVAVNAAKLGAPLKAAISFHGRLVGVEAKKNLLGAKILICQGGDDALVPEADQTAFRKNMDSIDADYTFISYPGAKHAYSNPEATALGQKFNMPIAYNAAADLASWEDMKSFFQTVFK